MYTHEAIFWAGGGYGRTWYVRTWYVRMYEKSLANLVTTEDNVIYSFDPQPRAAPGTDGQLARAIVVSGATG